MATRGTIGYETPEGGYVGVYVHYDSYPDNMLPQLREMSWDAVATEVSRALLQGGGRQLHGCVLDTFGESSDPTTCLKEEWPCTAEEYNYRKRLDGTVDCINSWGSDAA